MGCRFEGILAWKRGWIWAASNQVARGWMGAFRAKQGDDLVVGGEKSLGLAGGLEPAHDLLSSSCMAMRGFDPVVQPLMGPMIGTAAIHAERDVIAPELVGHHDVRLTPSAHQLAEKTSGSTDIAAFLDQNIQHVAPVIDGTPQPVRLTADGDNHLVDMPFVTRRRSVALDLRGDLRPEPDRPIPGSSRSSPSHRVQPANLNVPQAQVEPVIAPGRVRDHRSGKATPLQSQRRGQIHHSKGLRAPEGRQPDNAFTGLHWGRSTSMIGPIRAYTTSSPCPG